MEASSTSPLSIERLQSQVNELEAKLAHSNELMSKVREHKHNYSEDFGLVVSAPVKSLLKELINNPSIFSVEERERILDMFSESMEMRGIYECLGWPVGIQLSKVKNEMVPCIKNNVEFYTSLIGKNAEFQDRWLVSKLKMALNEADGLCAKLANIEHFEYGESEPFNLKAEIKDTFIKDNSAIGFRGGQPMQLEWFFGEYSDIMVDMNRKSFRVHLLGNIIKNLHDHAFNEPNTAIIVSLITGDNNGRNNVIDLYFQGSTYKSVIYDGNSKRLDNGLTFYENRKKTAWGNVKVRGEQFNIKFKNITNDLPVGGKINKTSVEKLAEILERDKRGELKTYSKEEFETILEARKQRLLEKIAQEQKQASGQ